MAARTLRMTAAETLRLQNGFRVGVAPRTHESHDGMHVVEGIVARSGDRRPVLGHCLPAPAYINSRQRQAPKQRRRIDHIQHDT